MRTHDGGSAQALVVAGIDALAARTGHAVRPLPVEAADPGPASSPVPATLLCSCTVHVTLLL